MKKLQIKRPLFYLLFTTLQDNVPEMNAFLTFFFHSHFKYRWKWICYDELSCFIFIKKETGENMDNRLQQLVNYFKDKFGLKYYQLETYTFHKETTYDGKTHYKCHLKLFPDATRDEAEEDYNPPGTAVIDYNLTTEKLASIQFVDGVSYATTTLFHNQTVQEIATWIERETDYQYEDDFNIVDTLNNGYIFQAEINGHPSSPKRRFEVEFDQAGKLTSFRLPDIHIMTEDIQEEAFTLTKEAIEPLLKQQVKLIQYPDEEAAAFIPLYSVEEVYITNDGKRMIPFLIHEREEIVINELLEWTTPLVRTIERKEIPPNIEVSLAEAFAQKSPTIKDTIWEEKTLKIIPIITDVLRTVLPHDSGKWTLATVRKKDHFLEVTCTWNDMEKTFFNRKFITLLEPISLEVLNYIDNGELFEIFDSFTPAPNPKITQAVAYEKLLPTIRLTPTYVFDVHTKQFQLCALLDSRSIVDAVTGKLIPLAES